MKDAAISVKKGFDVFRTFNAGRCGEAFHPVEAWSETDWMTAALGELGEAANLIKKRRRGEPVSAHSVAEELADAVTYIDLLAYRMGIDLGAALTAKFDKVSARIGSQIRFGDLTAPDPSASSAPSAAEK